MLSKISKGCVNVVQRFLPDPFIFCILLTMFVFVVAMPLTGQGPLQMVQHWGNGVWGLLLFSMQMALVLVLGSAMASAPIIKKVLVKLASIPKTPFQAIFLVTFVAVIACWANWGFGLIVSAIFAKEIAKQMKKLASIPKTPFQAIFLVTFVAVIACWANWGFGLIVSAIFAKEIAKQMKNVDYRLLIASAYSGFVVWHAGISGSVPLTIASVTDAVTAQTNGVLTESVPTTMTVFAPWNLAACLLILIVLPVVNAKMSVTDAVTAQTNGVLTESVPTTMTVFAPWNLAACLLILIVLPVVNAKMHPAPKDVFVVDPEILKEEEPVFKKPETPAEKLENSVILSGCIVVLGAAYIIYQIVSGVFSLSLDSVNLIFLVLGIAFHKTPIGYVRAIMEAAKGAGGIILQFPFYAGIQGMMVGANPVTGVSFAGVISVPVLCRYSGNDGRREPGDRRFFRRCDQPGVCINFKRNDIPALYILECGYRKLFCSIWRRTVGSTGSDHASSGAGPWCISGADSNVDCVGRCMDEPSAAVLGASGTWHGEAWSKRYYGLLCSRLARIRCYCFRISACGRSAWIVVCQNA